MSREDQTRPRDYNNNNRRLGAAARGATRLAVSVFIYLTAVSDVWSAVPTVDREAAGSNDVLSLLNDGKIEVSLSAKGANAIDVRVANLTDSPLEVEFPPSLVADGFAQNQVFAQIGGGGQGLGFLEIKEVSIASGAETSTTFRTACMNFGVKTPDHDTPMFLKSVTDYTANAKAQELLTRLAGSDVTTEVAQAALWHVTDRLSWEKLSRHGLRSSQKFRAQELAAARRWTDHQSGTNNGEAVAFAEQPADKPTGLSLTIHPDPRGSMRSGQVVRHLAGHFTSIYPMLDVNHRNHVVIPVDTSSTQVQWNVLVTVPHQPRTSKNGRPVSLTLRRSTWHPQRKRWLHEKPFVVRTEASAKQSNELEIASVVAEQVLSEISSRSIAVRWQRGGSSQQLAVTNSLPVALTSLTVHSRRHDDVKATLSPIEVPAQGRVVLELDPDVADRLPPGRRLAAVAFNVEG